MRKFGIAILSILFTLSIAWAQTKKTDSVQVAKAAVKVAKLDSTPVVARGPVRTLDKIAGVVGSSIILQSDIELQYANYLASGYKPNPGIKCSILQSLLTQKLLAQQAVIDSVSVKDDEVDNEVDRRMRGMVQRAGGQERLEQFLGRSTIQYKDEIRPDIKENMIAQKMRGKITEKINVTPLDVERYFNTIAKDSLPTYNKEIEVGDIAFAPKLNKEEIIR